MSDSSRAFAVAAHPDDIEFLMAGTLILLKRAGYEIHYMNIANGSCGTAVHSKNEITEIRREEAMESAHLIGAVYHEPLVDDIAIFYEPALLARVAAIMREVSPEILLLHSPQDYMEDHQNSARLGATAAFTVGMLNFQTDPEREAVEQQIAVYHAQPHGNQDILGDKIVPNIFVDITSVIDLKTKMLACHQSQKTWLDRSQGMDSYLHSMQTLSLEVGRMSGNFQYAEGWRKRLHYGFGSEEFSPLEEALGEFVLMPGSTASDKR